jgi:hypothetical protein
MPNYLNPDLTLTPEFYTSLPTMLGEELAKGPDGQPTKVFEPIKDFPSIVKMAAAAERKIGAKAEAATAEQLQAKMKELNLVKVPGEKATPEELSAYRNAVGVPQDPKGYEFDKIKAPEGAAFDPKTLGDFAAWAHQQGFPKGLARPDGHAGIRDRRRQETPR